MTDTPVTRPSLLLRVRDASDGDAWTEFVQLYAPVIRGYARRRGLQPDDAADILQDVLVSVSRAIESFDYQPQSGRFRAWLYTVTRNAVNDWFSARIRRPLATGDTDFHRLLNETEQSDGSDIWERDWQQRVFEWAVERAETCFEPGTWQAFWQVAVQGRAPADVARSLQLSVGAVYIAKSRVTARIRREIEELGDD